MQPFRFLGLLSVAPSLHSLASALPVATVVDFGLGFWIENIAVRATGEILAVGPFSPTLYQMNPLLPTPTKVAVYTSPVGGIVGIAETTPDQFYIVTGHFSGFLVPAPGSYAVWEVNMAGFDVTGKPAGVTKIAEFPTAKELDGMTTINVGTGLVEISDPALGVV